MDTTERLSKPGDIVRILDNNISEITRPSTGEVITVNPAGHPCVRVHIIHNQNVSKSLWKQIDINILHTGGRKGARIT